MAKKIGKETTGEKVIRLTKEIEADRSRIYAELGNPCIDPFIASFLRKELRQSTEDIIAEELESERKEASRKREEKKILRNKPLEDILVEAAVYAGEVLRQNAFSISSINWKKADDPVTEMDKIVEKGIRKIVSKYRPANFIGEEYGLEDNKGRYTWILDPLDGTKSYVKGDFRSSVSIAVKEKDELVAGLVYDFMKDIMYIGCYGNLKIIYRGKEVPFIHNNHLTKVNIYVDGNKELSALEEKGISVAEGKGSIALCMAHVATGAYDGMIVYPKYKGNVWDVAAGYYLLKKSNVYITDIEQKPFNYEQQDNGIIAINARAAEKLGMSPLG